MFKLFSNKSTQTTLVSPVTGKEIPLADVPDKVFASGMMGQGVAFELNDDILVAPADSEITMIPISRHAVGFKTASGVEILIHVGLNTVELNGTGFTVLAKQGDKVKAGTPVLRVDRANISAKGYQLVTPMVITNSDEFTVTPIEASNVVVGQTPVVEVKKI